MPHAILSVRLDDALEAQLQAFAAAHELSRSNADPITRGWMEGRQEAIGQVLGAVQEAVASLSREV